MNDDYDFNVASERMDADAVCAECGTVNPEGTLLCKTCGNNLRDQRARRTSGIYADDAADQTKRIPLVKVGLTLLAILVVVWTALNIDNIEEAMVYTQRGETNAARFWQGAESSAFNQLAKELTANPVTPRESDNAIEQMVNDGTYDGRYTLLLSGLGGRSTPIGDAIIKQEGDKILYVAVLRRSNVEIRGIAVFEENKRIASRGTAALKAMDEYYDASGFVQQSDAGGFECYGMTSLDTAGSYSARAYRVPSQNTN